MPLPLIPRRGWNSCHVISSNASRNVPHHFKVKYSSTAKEKKVDLLVAAEQSNGKNGKIHSSKKADLTLLQKIDCNGTTVVAKSVSNHKICTSRNGKKAGAGEIRNGQKKTLNSAAHGTMMVNSVPSNLVRLGTHRGP